MIPVQISVFKKPLSVESGLFYNFLVRSFQQSIFTVSDQQRKENLLPFPVDLKQRRFWNSNIVNLKCITLNA